jgi:hypothetical protein
MRFRPARARAGLVALLLWALGPAAGGAAAQSCSDMLVGTEDLEQILDQTLGSLRGLVDHQSVSIDPASSACYVRVSLSSSIQLQSGAACTLQACSSVIFRDKSIALRDFDVAGCDPVFRLFGLSRHVPSRYVDASARIRRHCDSSGFDIGGVEAVTIAGVPKLRIGFRLTPSR